MISRLRGRPINMHARGFQCFLRSFSSSRFAKNEFTQEITAGTDTLQISIELFEPGSVACDRECRENTPRLPQSAVSG